MHTGRRGRTVAPLAAVRASQGRWPAVASRPAPGPYAPPCRPRPVAGGRWPLGSPHAAPRPGLRRSLRCRRRAIPACWASPPPLAYRPFILLRSCLSGATLQGRPSAHGATDPVSADRSPPSCVFLLPFTRGLPWWASLCPLTTSWGGASYSRMWGQAQKGHRLKGEGTLPTAAEGYGALRIPPRAPPATGASAFRGVSCTDRPRAVTRSSCVPTLKAP